MKTEAEIVAGYVALQHAPDGSQAYRDSFWAYDEIYRLIHDDPAGALKLILLILANDDSPPVFQVLAAGPLEDLLDFHGEAVITTIEEEARRNPKFRSLLRGVWRR